jgi:hypothetical protein
MREVNRIADRVLSLLAPRQTVSAATCDTWVDKHCIITGASSGCQCRQCWACPGYYTCNSWHAC